MGSQRVGRDRATEQQQQQWEMGFPGGSAGEGSACSSGDQVQSLDWEDPLEKGMTNHSSILVWRIPWTEEPGGPQFTGLQRVGHNKRLSKHVLESIIALTTRPVGSPKVHPAIQGCPQRPDSFPYYTLALPVCR